MNLLPERLVLEPRDEAERLWAGALEDWARAPASIVALSSALDLGVRAAEILALVRLQAAKDRFPGTIALQLETPPVEVEPHRDGVGLSRTIDFAEILDLLSAEGLECIGARLHRGWEDRRFSCARARATAREAVGVTVDEAAREHLLLLAAYRNRLFRHPPPVELRPLDVRQAFPALIALVDRLRTTSP